MRGFEIKKKNRERKHSSRVGAPYYHGTRNKVEPEREVNHKRVNETITRKSIVHATQTLVKTTET